MEDKFFLLQRIKQECVCGAASKSAPQKRFCQTSDHHHNKRGKNRRNRRPHARIKHARIQKIVRNQRSKSGRRDEAQRALDFLRKLSAFQHHQRCTTTYEHGHKTTCEDNNKFIKTHLHVIYPSHLSKRAQKECCSGTCPDSRAL